MHTEVDIAFKFVVSYLFNKLPRRRVNLFGEELEHALIDKFKGHWYPDQPFKGSAYRCLKITDQSDPVLNQAARESGNSITDIIDNLPADLAIWIDPGEVSYRIGEKGSVKILYSKKNNGNMNLEDINPEVRNYLEDNSITSPLNVLSISEAGYNGMVSPLHGPSHMDSLSFNRGPPTPIADTVSPPFFNGPSMKNSNGQTDTAISNGFETEQVFGGVAEKNQYTPRQPPMLFTAATFAQTKFGSTKLKTSNKKSNKMSPTEFSNYIKQRAVMKSYQEQTSNDYYNGKNGYQFNRQALNDSTSDINGHITHTQNALLQKNSKDSCFIINKFNEDLSNQSHNAHINEDNFKIEENQYGILNRNHSESPKKSNIVSNELQWSNQNMCVDNLLADVSTFSNSGDVDRTDIQKEYKAALLNDNSGSNTKNYHGQDYHTQFGEGSVNWLQATINNHPLSDKRQLQNHQERSPLEVNTLHQIMLERKQNFCSSSFKPPITSCSSGGMSSAPTQEDTPALRGQPRTNNRVQVAN